MPELLRLENVWAGYGEAVVLEDISFALEEGDSLSLLGRNGMGKTTLLSTLMGAAHYQSGVMQFAGQDLSAVPAHARAHLGLGWVPQERDIFPSLTVEENLTVVATDGPWDLSKVYEMFPRLNERRNNMGNQLSGGEQQMLTLGRTLMTNPSVLLLDEPLEGLAPIIVEELTAAIRKMAGDGAMALVLVEQHAEVALRLTEDALVIERGRIAHRARSADLLADRETLERHLSLKLGAKPQG